jgi:hypothetical protein
MKRLGLAALALSTPLTALAQNATVGVPAILNGNPVTIRTPYTPNADGTYSQQISAVSPSGGNLALETGGNLASIVAAIPAPINAQTTHGVNIGGVEGVTVASTPGTYPITVQPQSTGFAVTASGAVTVATNSAGTVNLVQSDSSAAINVSTATTTQIVALVSGKSIYVTGWDIVVAAADTITLEYGTGTNCGTGTTTLTGAYSFAANGGLATGSGLGVLFRLPASNALCVVTSAAVQASGRVSYAQF